MTPKSGGARLSSSIVSPGFLLARDGTRADRTDPTDEAAITQSTRRRKNVTAACKKPNTHARLTPDETPRDHPRAAGSAPAERSAAEACRRNMHCTAMRLAVRTRPRLPPPHGDPVCPRALHLPQFGRQRGALGGVQRTRRHHRGAHRRAVLLPPPRRARAPRGAAARGRGGGLPGIALCCGTRRRRRSGARTRRSPARSCWRCRRTRAISTEDRIDAGAQLRRAALRGEGPGGAARRARAARGRIGIRAGELARASADHHAADRGRDVRAKKARDLDPEVRRAGGRAVVGGRPRPGASCGATTRTAISAEHGLDLRVDPTATHARRAYRPGADAQGGLRDPPARRRPSGRRMRRRRAIPTRCWRR